MFGAGHLMRTVNHGFQYATQYLWPRRPAVNLLSVAPRAKGDVVLGVHVKRQTGGAAVVTVKKTSNHTYNGYSNLHHSNYYNIFIYLDCNHK